ncbi:hypothetical protein Tco_1500513 [Tanacetum coccineum]
MDSGTEGRPLILEKGSYVPWASQFLRFLDNRREEGVLMQNSIDNGIPNDIYNSVDACGDAQGMWNQIKVLMQGIVIIKTKDIAIDTKLLNSLQLEWSKYVTLTSQKYILETEHFDELYDYLSQFELHVNASKEKKTARNHDPLALVANSYANPSHSHASPSYSCSPPPYYVTHPYLCKIMMMIVKERYKEMLRKANRNPRYAGNGNMNVGHTNRNQSTNAGKGLVQKIKENEENVQRIPRTASTLGKINV